MQRKERVGFSIKVKLIILIIVIAFALSAIVGAISITKSSAALQSKNEEEITNIAERVSSEVQQFFDKNFAYLDGLGKADIVKNPNGDVVARKALLIDAAKSYGVKDIGVVDLNGISLTDTGKYVDLSGREWAQNGFKGLYTVSDPYEDSTEPGKMIMVFAGPLYNGSNIVGCIYMICPATYLSEIVDAVEFGETGKAYIVNSEGTMIAHENGELVSGLYNVFDKTKSLGADAANFDTTSFANAVKTMTENESGYVTYNFTDGKTSAGFATNETTNWKVVARISSSEIEKSTNEMTLSIVIVVVIALAAAVVLGILIISALMGPLTLMKKKFVNLSRGDFSDSIATTNRSDEIGALQNAAHDLQTTIVNIINDENEILSAMANCDLSVREMPPLPGEFDKLSSSVNYIKATLRDLVMEIQTSASQVDIGSKEIAAATENLSQGTTAQAMSIDQVVNDTEDIANRIIENSENEKTVENRLHELNKLINTGNEGMTKLLRVVNEVEQMSADIQKIVATIDGISFQTNILALNASVEAARAGESGKGFAVVADEVGNLADKSGESSKQTAALIEQCLKGIKDAAMYADETFKCLGEIVENSGEIETAFSEIAEATRAQAEKSANIKNEIESVSNVVQTNMATSEETAAASEQLSAQAASMSSLVQKFKL